MRILFFVLLFISKCVVLGQAIAVQNGDSIRWNLNSSWNPSGVPTSSNTGTWANNRANKLFLQGNANGSCTNGSVSASNASTGFICGEIGAFTNNKNGGEISINYGRIRIVGNFTSNGNSFTVRLNNNSILK